jgi:hypothetical protein
MTNERFSITNSHFRLGALVAACRFVPWRLGVFALNSPAWQKGAPPRKSRNSGRCLAQFSPARLRLAQVSTTEYKQIPPGKKIRVSSMQEHLPSPQNVQRGKNGSFCPHPFASPVRGRPRLKAARLTPIWPNLNKFDLI